MQPVATIVATGQTEVCCRHKIHTRFQTLSREKAKREIFSLIIVGADQVLKLEYFGYMGLNNTKINFIGFLRFKMWLQKILNVLKWLEL